MEIEDLLLSIFIRLCATQVSTSSKTCTVFGRLSQWTAAVAAAAAAAAAPAATAAPVVDENQPPISLSPKDSRRYVPADRFDTCSCDRSLDRRVCSNVPWVADAPRWTVTNIAWQLQASSANYHPGDQLCARTWRQDYVQISMTPFREIYFHFRVTSLPWNIFLPYFRSSDYILYAQNKCMNFLIA